LILPDRNQEVTLYDFVSHDMVWNLIALCGTGSQSFVDRLRFCLDAMYSTQVSAGNVPNGANTKSEAASELIGVASASVQS